MYQYDATLDRVVDGDTVFLGVDMGFHIHATIDFRLARINAPEMKGTTLLAGQAAKDALAKFLASGSLRIHTQKADKYGRWLAEIMVTPLDGSPAFSANQAMLDWGFAVPYVG